MQGSFIEKSTKSFSNQRVWGFNIVVFHPSFLQHSFSLIKFFSPSLKINLPMQSAEQFFIHKCQQWKSCKQMKFILGEEKEKQRPDGVLKTSWCMCVCYLSSGECGASFHSKGNRGFFSKHKHMLSIKNGFLKRETHTRSWKITEVLALINHLRTRTLWLSTLD